MSDKYLEDVRQGNCCSPHTIVLLESDEQDEQVGEGLKMDEGMEDEGISSTISDVDTFTLPVGSLTSSLEDSQGSSELSLNMNSQSEPNCAC